MTSHVSTAIIKITLRLCLSLHGSRHEGERLQWISNIALSNRLGRCKPCLCIWAIGKAWHPRISGLRRLSTLQHWIPDFRMNRVKLRNLAQDVTPEHRRTGWLLATVRCITLPRQKIYSVVVLTQRSTLTRATALQIACQNGAEVGHSSASHWLEFQGFKLCFRYMMQERFSYLRGRIPKQPPITRCQPCSISVPWKILRSQ